MKNFILIYLFFGIFSSVDAQNTGGVIGATNDLYQYLNPMQSEGLYVSIKKSDKMRDESQYLFKENEGDFQIFFNQNKGFSIKNLNYNINSNTLESKMGKDSIFEFDNDKIDFIQHSSKKYKFYNINNSSQLYQELLVSEKIIFLKGFKLIHKEAFINPMTNALISEAKDEIKEKYYCKISDKEFVQFDLKKKSVLILMEDKYSLITKFVSESNLSYNSENDLIKIFNYFNTL